MNKNNFDEEQKQFIDKAISGDMSALETLLSEVQDLVFNLSLRMLGTVPDAEDATQEILIRIITHLSSFRGESAFKTWVYRLSVNYLINYKKSMFSHAPLDFEVYGNDIRYAVTDETDNLIDEITRETMSEELKLSCTNVMLQCFDAKSRCIYILGTMFGADSRIAGEILDMTPENYRQKLSRLRKKMAEFLSEYCGLAGSGLCSCKRRVDYAVKQHRIQPDHPDFLSLKPLDKNILMECKEEMEKLDELSCTFESFPHYQSPVRTEQVLKNLLQSSSVEKIQQY